MRKLIPAAVGLLVLLATTGCTKTADKVGFSWPQWRGPDGNGQSRETEWDPAAIAAPRILWAADVGLGYSNVVIQKGRLYTLGEKAGADEVNVFCLDAVTGKQVWRRSLPSIGEPQATPFVDGDSLFVQLRNGYLYRLETASGKLRWRTDLMAEHGARLPTYGFAGSPVVEGDLVILTINTSGMAIKRETGELAWTSEKPPDNFEAIARTFSTGTEYSTPVVYDGSNGRQALICGWNGLYSVDVTIGSVTWRFGWDIEPTGLDVDPLINGNRICLSLAYEPTGVPSGILLQMRENKVELLWKSPDLYCWISSPIILGTSIFTCYGGPPGPYPSVTSSLRCLDLETGRMRREQHLTGDKKLDACSLTAANGILIVLDDKGTLYTSPASSEGFEEIARCDVLQGANRPRKFWTPPVLCNAKIYCSNYAGDLVCIDVSK